METNNFSTPFSELAEGEVNFVDFLPNCLSAGRILKNAEYDTFKILMNRANDWLRSNPHYDIIKCESIEFKDKNDKINPQMMVYVEFGGTYYVRGLRIWIKKCRSGCESAKQIGYMNVVPLQKKASGIFTYPDYENLEEVINRYNLGIRIQPLPGRVITIETVGAKVKGDLSGLDLDCSNWVGVDWRHGNHFIFFLRIFYQESYPTFDEIGIKDFVPERISSSCTCNVKYEPFVDLVAQANEWCSSQTDLRICNFQTVQTMLFGIVSVEANSQKMLYYECTERRTFYVRILRAAFIKISAYSNTEYTNSSPLTQFSCKTFAPAQLTKGLTIPEFETLEQTGKRISAWTKATGSQMINMETVSLRLNTRIGAECSADKSFTYNPENRSEIWIYVIRAYIKGTYQEPRSEELPPLPEIQTKCCSII